jgi:hypothetical protein
MVARDSVVRCCRVRCQPIGAGAGVQSRVAELLADPQHQFDGLRGGGPRGTVRAPGPGLQRRVTLGPVARQQLIEPGPGNAVGRHDLRGAAPLDLDCRDDQPGFRHGRASADRPA